MLRSGMERGVNDGYDRLDEILAKNRQTKTQTISNNHN
jgi:hypothetical protein